MIHAEAKRGEKESLRKYIGRLTGLTGKAYKSAYDRARYAARVANATIGTKYTAAGILQERAKVQKFGYSSKTLEAVYLASKARGGTAENRGRDFLNATFGGLAGRSYSAQQVMKELNSGQLSVKAAYEALKKIAEEEHLRRKSDPTYFYDSGDNSILSDLRKGGEVPQPHAVSGFEE